MDRNKYPKGTLVWCRPRIIDEPMQGEYIRSITKEENNQGYRYGEIVKIGEYEVWVRSDLCDVDIEKIRDIDRRKV